MARSTQLAFQELSDRIVPAVQINLTTLGAENMAGGAIVRQLAAQPAAGTFDPFVRIQGADNANGVEQGYNTSARPLQFDERPNVDFTHNLQLSSVPVVTIGGTAYREFLLDVNQKNGAAKFSVEEVRIFTNPLGSLATYQNKTNTFAGQQAKFNLDSGGDVTIILNDNVNPDANYGDMVLLVPDSNFAGVAGTDFVYLYSRMGAKHAANGGAEEWAVRNIVAPPPPTGTSSLSGGVYYDELQDQQLDGQYDGIAGIEIYLTGTDVFDNVVNMTATTDATGNYLFPNLNAGNYTITQGPTPSHFMGIPIEDGADYRGSFDDAGFGEDNDSIINIALGNEMHGVGIDFTETLDVDG